MLINRGYITSLGFSYFSSDSTHTYSTNDNISECMCELQVCVSDHLHEIIFSDNKVLHQHARTESYKGQRELETESIQTISSGAE